ncbi:MAG: hypothetical protein Q8O55_08770 [Dehalococcoidales bacterium]|nr:hypothetical protein [Dehalococcoidales bacterium]
MDFGSSVAIIISAISLAATCIAIGVWKGRIDALLKVCGDCQKSLPLAVDRLQNKMDVVWKLTAGQLLEDHPNLAIRHSPFSLTEQGRLAIATIQPLLDDIKHKKSGLTASDVPVEILQRSTEEELLGIAKQCNCSVALLISLATVELGVLR